MVYKLREGDVVCFKYNPESFYSRAIHKFTGSDYSHVGIVYSVDYDNNKCIIAEALDRGFVKNEYYISGLADTNKFKIRRSKSELLKVKEFIDKYEGMRYDWLAIAIISIRLIFNVNLYYETENALICSEAVSRVLYDSSYKMVNFENEFDVTFDLVTPANLVESVQLKTIYL